MINAAIQLLQGLLTPVIGSVAVYIAYQQWRTNRDRLILDKYERRLRIYEEVKKLVTIVNRDQKVSMDDLMSFRTATAEADFLFGSDVQEYCDEFRKRGFNLWYATQKYNPLVNNSGDHDRDEVAAKLTTELDWFEEQEAGAKEVFRRDLDMSGGKRKRQSKKSDGHR